MKAPDLKEKLEESEKLLREMRKTWEEKLSETEKIHQVSKSCARCEKAGHRGFQPGMTQTDQCSLEKRVEA